MFFKRFAKGEALVVADAHEFVMDCLTSAIAGIHGAKQIRAKRLDDETIELMIREQLYIVRIEEAAQALAKKRTKSAKKTTKAEGSSDVG